jgi:hypothetical protein
MTRRLKAVIPARLVLIFWNTVVLWCHQIGQSTLQINLLEYRRTMVPSNRAKHPPNQAPSEASVIDTNLATCPFGTDPKLAGLLGDGQADGRCPHVVVSDHYSDHGLCGRCSCGGLRHTVPPEKMDAPQHHRPKFSHPLRQRLQPGDCFGLPDGIQINGFKLSSGEDVWGDKSTRNFLARLQFVVKVIGWLGRNQDFDQCLSTL